MNAEPTNGPAIECRGIIKNYHDGTRELRILRGVNLSIGRNESVAICGQSGAGKSTLLHIMGTLDAPTDGELSIDGKSAATFGRSDVDRIRNEHIGFVFQFYHLLPEFTALENVMMPGLGQGKRMSVCKPRAEELLAKVGLTDRITHKPGQLSGGEQQRVAIARALFNRPTVVLADEPTGNLDEKTGVGIIELLWQLNDSESTTLVLVTHDEQVAKRAHRTVWLHDGVIHTSKP
jgi:lipoprotein-releasing system ATP-binding protein